jgi:hypothetical protein
MFVSPGTELTVVQLFYIFTDLHKEIKQILNASKAANLVFRCWLGAGLWFKPAARGVQSADRVRRVLSSTRDDRFTYIYTDPVTAYTARHPDRRVSAFWQVLSSQKND